MNEKELNRIFEEIIEGQRSLQEKIIRLKLLLSDSESQEKSNSNIADESKLPTLHIGGSMKNGYNFFEINEDYLDDEITDAEKIRIFATKLITEKNRPIKVKFIHEKAIESKIDLPGKGTLSNIIIAITKDPKNRFVKFSKGVYGLAQLNHRGKNVGFDFPNITR
mgnify:FL=1|tara:strand:+ start:622 stop:1116 length:495 start_codon:yes stop_codon:yes gene_type:complete